MTEAEARARLLRIADRLRQVPTGSAEADQAIHQALGRAGRLDGAGRVATAQVASLGAEV